MSSSSTIVRPAQRGRHGVLGLNRLNRPTADEMAFDKLTIYVPGFLVGTNNEAEPTGLLNGYRSAMIGRADNEPGVWTRPVEHGVDFETRLLAGRGTISTTKLKVRWADERHPVRLTMNVNVTRTLIHALALVGGRQYSEAYLDALSVSDFFTRSGSVASADTLDGGDNAFDNLNDIRARLGHDYSRAFMPVFERHLQGWATNVIAPEGAGFQTATANGYLIADNGVQRVALEWPRLVVSYAEIYCERRHGSGAPALMERLNSLVMSSHSDANWRRYEISEIGGRQAGSTVIGIEPTAGIKQVYYAKTRDRIRLETRYTRRVRDNLRGATTSQTRPLTDLLLLLRQDAASRVQWEAFCAMSAEPATPLIADYARMAGAIARCAVASKVDPEQVFATLLGSGGFDQTPAGGAFPPKLVRRLADEGLISSGNLTRRRRPGRPLRHHLVEPYSTISTMMQRAFASAEPSR